MIYCFSLDFLFVFVEYQGKLWYLVIAFLYLTAWLVNINNSGAAVFNMFAKSKSCGDICLFDQHYQPSKIISQVLPWRLNIMLLHLLNFGVISVVFLALITVAAEIVINKLLLICSKRIHYLKRDYWFWNLITGFRKYLDQGESFRLKLSSFSKFWEMQILIWWVS